VNLRTSMQISAIFPIALAIMVSLAMYLRVRTTNRIQDDLRRTEDLVTSISDYESATYAFLLNHDDAEKRAAWGSRSDALRRMLMAHEGDAIEEYTMAKIRADQRQANAAALEIMDLHGARIALGLTEWLDSSEYAEQERRLTGHMRSMRQAAFDLAKNRDSKAAFAEQTIDTYFMVFIGVMALLMAGSQWAAGRDVVRRLRGLREVSSRVANGEFGHQLDAGLNDEIGESLQAFNAMLRRIEEWFSELRGEIDGLRAEMDSHRSASAAAGETNIRLAGAVSRMKESQAEAVHRERLRALEQMGTGLTRDLSATLTPILGASDLLLSYPQELAEREAVEADLRTINTAARRAREQIRLLAEFFAAQDEPCTRPVRAGQVLIRAIDRIDPLIKRLDPSCPVRVEQEPIPEGLPLVRGDVENLVGAMERLMTNGVEAMPNGGTLWINAREDSGHVVLRVRDSGLGMKGDVLKRCTEPFFTTKGPGHSGIGLTAASATATRYGGNVRIESKEGKGTIVSLWLPGCAAEEPAGNDADAGADRPLRILLVDDEAGAREFLRRGLTAMGHSVTVAADGDEGLRAFSESDVDLALVDRVMPGMSGDELAAKFREQRPDLPIIMISGYGESMETQRMKPACVDLVLSKPVTVDELGEALRRALQAHA